MFVLPDRRLRIFYIARADPVRLSVDIASGHIQDCAVFVVFDDSSGKYPGKPSRRDQNTLLT